MAGLNNGKSNTPHASAHAPAAARNGSANGGAHGPALAKPTPAPQTSAASDGPKGKIASSAANPMASTSGTANSIKRVFTTGEAAEVCKVSQQTIIRCFDAGRLGGFRVPGSKFRRIPRADLIKFMKGNDIPLENLAAYEGSSVSHIAEGDDHGPRRVLIVDDDAQILDLFKDLFAGDARFAIKLASTGYDAGMLTESFRPHLIILDFMLPDVNGDVVCQRLRAADHLKNTKVLFVSGVVSQSEIERLTSAGASGFIAKPFDVNALMRRVEQLVEMPAK